eukprot:CAMPEP_0114631684 /NCGR_PEP_ID=MMETSP0168-20121206/14543_1 /TAXON_ID=95228 ORGANISM="Vannella sp., Strain DIVA3 517/6/12" /NCGR_SAMPLE_ID=MMETSP0168 /ASSEMBLY_ACC=CAM_ASM_000044 /LENGTH=142 /DNA_ID=CAMNT_0001843265 /DNA_START=69 /DNA_END=499 /DNA_ORIENTATION=+
MNPAMSYVLNLMTEESYNDFLDTFLALMMNLAQWAPTEGSEANEVHMDGQPYIVAPRADFTPYTTQTRNERYRDITKQKVERSGFTYFDTIPMTKGRPEETWDGLHYLRGQLTWAGHVTASVMQELLNEIYGSEQCRGPEYS